LSCADFAFAIFQPSEYLTRGL